MAYHFSFHEGCDRRVHRLLKVYSTGKASGYIPMISSVTGDIVSAEDLATAQYWALNLASPVEFEKAFASYLAYSSQKASRIAGKTPVTDFSAVTHVLEVGPHSALQGPIREILRDHAGPKPQYVASLVRREGCSTLHS